jgi:TonB family protein
MRVDCSPLPGFAAAVASGTCIAQPAEAFDLASIYPKEALAAGIEGRVGVYVLMNEREGRPLLVETIQSSGSPLLDTAALEGARNMIYRSDCDAGYRTFAIDFQLAD